MARNRTRAAALSLAAATLAVGSAAGLQAGDANATPKSLGAQHDQLTTDDGWRIKLESAEMVVNPMHNIANAPTSREGWISSKVTGLVEGHGAKPVQAAIVEHFLVIGCQVDVSNGATVGISGSFGPNVGVTISGVPGATAGVSASVSPQISANIKPGKISEISLGKKQLQGDRASIRVKRARVSVDGCWGKVSTRIIGRLSVSTQTADDTINILSARTWL
ncbi:MspA family porin [Gordonia malaquae]|uniref:MspA family porin n=1 Tax=Gordonia malaquae TaxID=410332 RepID=UPI0030C78FC6